MMINPDFGRLGDNTCSMRVTPHAKEHQTL